MKRELTKKFKELRAINLKIGLLNSRLNDNNINKAYSVKVTLLKRDRRTYGKNRYFWNKSEGADNYISLGSSIYFNRATLTLGQDLWSFLDDSIKEKVKDCFTSDKYESVNNIRAVLDEVYKNKAIEDLTYLMYEKEEIKREISKLQYIEEELSTSN
jgi:hypothetical protein